ncbi:hypothetical protein BVC80_8137g6 [Macleaya cordata]|uniref:Uncharacterized protein n=1 Tax=Macleaya cordata TaxID=56857 RepID=A0A200PUY0_MACCD|nr:hypothetical protein BVC80_8137g6 [Macleaya cordata]
MVTCCRITQHLRSCDLGFYYSPARFRYFISTSSFGLSSSSLKPYSERIQRMMISSIASSRPVGFLQAQSSSGESPVLTDCFRFDFPSPL